jgi:hypothetical protein
MPSTLIKGLTGPVLGTIMSGIRSGCDGEKERAVADLPEGSVYVRLSLMQPKSGQEAEVSKILSDLVAFYAQQPGYIRGFTLVSPARESQIGRLTFWTAERDAENVANTQHVLALRAELLRHVEPGTDNERSFVAEETAASPA